MLVVLHPLTADSIRITEAQRKSPPKTLHAPVNTLEGHMSTHVHDVHVIGRIRPWPSCVGVGGRRGTEGIGRLGRFGGVRRTS